jgi:DNA (cytosine-5)-methyltransferase 1
MALGFEQAGFDVVAAVELDPIHSAVHEYNFPQTTMFCRSVAEITGEEIREQSRLGDRAVDVLFGGPPCQGFSVIGKRDSQDLRNTLVAHFARVVVELRPRFFVMENVPGMLRQPSKRVLTETIHYLQSHGYFVKSNYQVLNAALYGVPQDRNRLFLMGCDRGWPLPLYPAPKTQPKNHRKFKQTELFALPPTPTVNDAIGDLPEINDYEELETQDWIPWITKPDSDYARILAGMMKAQDDYGYDRIYPQGRLTGSLRTNHAQTSIDRFRDTPPGKAEKISRFHRLAPNGLCNTLRAGTSRTRGSHTSPRPIHPVAPRCISVREAARLHSYPDWFHFHSTKLHGFREVGNSVPPYMAKAIAQEIIKALAIKPSKPDFKLNLSSMELLSFTMTEAANYYDVDPNVIAPRTRKKSA